LTVNDPYSVLGVSRSASQDEIKKAYRKLASRLHPDKSVGKASEQRFKDVTGAYEVLGDGDKRALYDEFGDISLRAGFDAERARAAKNFNGFGGFSGGPGGGAQFDLGDLFGGRTAQPGGSGGGIEDVLGDLFGGGGGRRGQGGMRRKGQDAASTVSIGFADAVRGTTLKLTPSDGGDLISVRIPPGANDGSRVRVRGKGGAGMGGPPGDLILTLSVHSHPHFSRDGEDLLLELPISIKEAYAGAQVTVPTPHGEVKLTVPERVQSGQKMRLRGKGVAPKGKPAGDLYVRFMVMYPEGEGADFEKALDALGSLEGDPRDGISF
jgi:curved DNA-binding protein